MGDLQEFDSFEQSVTLTAEMWPNDNSTSSGHANIWTFRVPKEQLPLVIAVFTGGAVITLLIVAAVMWKFCVAPYKIKNYRVKIDDSPLPVPVLPSESAVYLDPKSGQWSVSSRMVDVDGGTSNHWFYNNRILDPSTLDRVHSVLTRSVTVPTHLPDNRASTSTPTDRRCNGALTPPLSLPQISEFSPHITNYCISTTVLDEDRTDYLSPFNGVMLKTQSLPACVRNKPKTGDTPTDSTDLYPKVNFSKKRKNRMRNDEAAIIALSKSRSQFLHRDTDSLVDNEAVVVYDERTAL